MENNKLPKIQTGRSEVAFLAAKNIRNGNNYDSIQEGGGDTVAESPSVKWKQENEHNNNNKGSQNSSVNTSTDTELSKEENVDNGYADDDFDECYINICAYNDDGSNKSETETPISSVRESKQTSGDSEENTPKPENEKRKIMERLSETSSRQQVDRTVCNNESRLVDEERAPSKSLSLLDDIKIETSPFARTKHDTRDNDYRCKSSSKYHTASSRHTPLEKSKEEVTPIPPPFVASIRLNNAHSKGVALLSTDKGKENHSAGDHVVTPRHSVPNVDRYQWNTQSVASYDNSCNVTTNCSTSSTTAYQVRNTSSPEQNLKSHERTRHVTTKDLQDCTSPASLPITDQSPPVNTDKTKVKKQKQRHKVQKKPKDTQSEQLLKETKQHGSHKTITPTICRLEDFSIADYQRELPATGSLNSLVLRQASSYVSRARAPAKNIKKIPVPPLDMDKVSRKQATKESPVPRDTLPPIPLNKVKLDRMYQQKYNNIQCKSAKGCRSNLFPPVFKTNEYNSKPKLLNDKCQKAMQTKSGLSMMGCYSSVNRHVIQHRAQWPPFNTYVDAEAPIRFKKMFTDHM